MKTSETFSLYGVFLYCIFVQSTRDFSEEARFQLWNFEWRNTQNIILTN